MSDRLKELLRESGLPRESAELSPEASGRSEESGFTDQDLAQLESTLAEIQPSIDLSALTAKSLEALRPDLEENATRAYGRRTLRAVLTALVPLPLVLASAGYALLFAHGWISQFLPDALATYLVTSYGASLVLMIATTYACIPLIAERTDLRRLAPAGASL